LREREREKEREGGREKEIAVNTKGSANISITLDTKYRECDNPIFRGASLVISGMVSGNIFTSGLSHLHDIVTDGLTSRIHVNPVYFLFGSPVQFVLRMRPCASVRIIRENTVIIRENTGAFQVDGDELCKVIMGFKVITLIIYNNYRKT